MRVMISGGGTGGHIYPALAIAGEIKTRRPDSRILYVGTKNGLESKVVPLKGIPFKSINITSLDRKSFLKAGKTILKMPNSFREARHLIKLFKPEIVIGTGGYVSFPVVFVGSFMGCKTYIHEQNAYPGLSNRWLAKRADCTFLTFADAQEYLKAKKIKVTGLPVRQEVIDVKREEAIQSLDIAENRFTLLIFGGSLGAESINKAVLEIIDRYLIDNMQIIWITGERGYNNVKKIVEPKIKVVNMKYKKARVLILPFTHNIENALAVADLAVCRAGAGTLSELAVRGIPAILIPYPYAAENHQEKNALSLLKKNAVALIKDEELNGEILFRKIEEIKNNQEKLSIMKKNILQEAKIDALKSIVDEIIS